jgi:pimeloyl-ACP methyl ester carboxylesterase
MKNEIPGYYALEKPQRGIATDFFRSVYRYANWAFSFFLRRVIIDVALAPNDVRPQEPMHVMFLTDDRTEKGSVILNLLSPEMNQPGTNYYSKLPSSVTEGTRLEYSLDNPEHKAHVDSIIDEIGRLMTGKSEDKKCKGKHFNIEELHIKGMERLQAPLLDYFKQQVQQKYGVDFFERPRTLGLNFFTLETADDALLESLELSSAEERMKPIAERKFVISCMARNQNYMYWLKDLYTTSVGIGCSVVSFNYRGIDYSRGTVFSQEELVNDARAQAQRLIEMGANPENIAFEGMSMGGAVATIAAARMHEQGLKVSLYNERSYRSLVRLMVGYVLPDEKSSLWNPITLIQYAFAGFAYLFVLPGLWMLGWHLNSAGAWDTIPQAYKSFSVARNHFDPEHPDDDDFVNDSFASIASLMDEHRIEVQQKLATHEALSPDEQQLLKDIPESHDFTLDREAKINDNPSPHSAPRRFMQASKSGEHNLHDHMIEQVGHMLHVR